VQDFKKLAVWQKSYQLVLDVYRFSQKFPKEELYGLTSQARRAAVSVPANIAEGSGKSTQVEFARFLDIAMGSLSELECYLELTHDLNYLSDNDYAIYLDRLIEIRRMLAAFIQTVRKNR
jgi:four helix bundle protein